MTKLRRLSLTAYEAPTADSAEATRTARPETPRTGCNGYPYSRMKRAVFPGPDQPPLPPGREGMD